MLFRMLVGLTLIAFAQGGYAQYSWEQKSDFPGGVRINSIAFSVGEKGYIGGGGIITAVTAFDDLWEYDPWTDTWTQKAKFPGTPRTQAVSFSMAGKGYVGLGFDPVDGYVNDFWEYDPALDQWTRLADFPGLPRDYAIAFSIGDYAYMGLGTRFAVGQTDFYRYDPATDQWSVRDSFPGSPRINPVGFAIADKGYVTTGAEPNPPSWPNDMWEYDPTADSWTKMSATIVGTRNQGVGFSVKHKAVIGFGNSASGFRKDFWVYDSDQENWTIVNSNFPADVRNAAVGLSIGNRVFAGIGNNGTIDLKDFWELKGVVPQDLGTDENLLDDPIKIRFFPNPVTSLVHFVWERPHYGTLRWYSTSGELVREFLVHNSTELLVHREGLPTGLYHIQWLPDNGLYQDLGNLLIQD